MAKKKTQKTAHKKSTVGIGVGVTAAMLAAAGGYFLYGSKNATRNRKQVKSWMLKAKAEILDGIEDAKDISKEDYEKLVDKATKAYGKLRSTSGKELKAFSREMKSHWKDIERKGEKVEKKVVKKAKSATKAAKKAVSKVSRKSTKKTSKSSKRKVVKKAVRKKPKSR